jgi:acetyl/propionyl-CoA carboxylase alpha subunit
MAPAAAPARQTNLNFLLAMMADDVFLAGAVDTSYIEVRGPGLMERAKLGAPAKAFGTAFKPTDQTELLALYLAQVRAHARAA